MKAGKFRSYVAAGTFVISLSACSTSQQTTAESDITNVANSVQAACTTVNATASVIGNSPLSLVPQVAGVLPYVTASCGTAAAISAMVAKAASDPTTVAWIQNLNSDLTTDISAAKSAL